MARFGSEAELAAFLSKLDPDYAHYAPALWLKGIKNTKQLSNFTEPHYLACNVLEGHIDDIKARAESLGELLACNNLLKARAVISHHSVGHELGTQPRPCAPKACAS